MTGRKADQHAYIFTHSPAASSYLNSGASGNQSEEVESVVGPYLIITRVVPLLMHLYEQAECQSVYISILFTIFTVFMA